MQWFIFNFQCIVSSPEETVNHFCSFHFLKESLYETFNLQTTYLYEPLLPKCYLNDRFLVLFVVLRFLHMLVKLLDKSRDGNLLFPRFK